VEQELRLNAIYPRRVLQRLDEVGQKRIDDLRRIDTLVNQAGVDEDISNNRFVCLIYAKTIADNLTCAWVKGDVAGKNALIEILQQIFDGLRVIPEQKVVPDSSFGLQEGAEVLTGVLT